MKRRLSILIYTLLGLMLLNCGGNSISDEEYLFNQACEGNKQAQKELYNLRSKRAGQFQEQYADEIAYSDPELAEQWWERAAQNGVQDGGPNFPVFFFIRKHWLGILVLLTASTLWGIYEFRSDEHKKTAKKPNIPPRPKPNHPQKYTIIIDTNIWMQEELHGWFCNLKKAVKASPSTILLESIVLGELKGLSQNEAKSHAARMGMARIEQLQSKLGNKFQLVDNSLKSDAKADTVLMRTAAKIGNSILITDDRELRILAKSKGINAKKASECQF